MNINFKIGKFISLAFGVFLLNNRVLAMNNNFADHPLVNPAKANLSVVRGVSENGAEIYHVDYTHAGTNFNMVVDPAETQNLSCYGINLYFSDGVKMYITNSLANVTDFGFINVDAEAALIKFQRDGMNVENFVADCNNTLFTECKKEISFDNIFLRSQLDKARFSTDSTVTVNHFEVEGDTVSVGGRGRSTFAQGNVDCRSFLFVNSNMHSTFSNFNVDCDEFLMLALSEATINGTRINHLEFGCSCAQGFIDLFSNFHGKRGVLSAEFTNAGPYQISKLSGDVSVISFPNANGMVAATGLDPRCPAIIYM